MLEKTSRLRVLNDFAFKKVLGARRATRNSSSPFLTPY
jgi:hypothetical protein